MNTCRSGEEFVGSKNSDDVQSTLSSHLTFKDEVGSQSTEGLQALWQLPLHDQFAQQALTAFDFSNDGSHALIRCNDLIPQSLMISLLVTSE